MKRLIALMLCVSLLTGMLPAASLAETLLYTYPPVNAYLVTNDMAALEYEFRQWAARVLEAYLYENTMELERGRRLGELSSAAVEYYRMADTKMNFDRSKEGNIEENIYSNNEMNESERQGMYLWVFLESIKEKMYADDFAILKQYGNIEKDEKRYWMLDVETGELTRDSLAQQAQNASNDVTTSKWAKVGSDLLISTLETVGNYFVITKGADEDLGDLINIIGDSFKDSIKMAIDVNKTNALTKVDNAVRAELEKDLAEAVNNVSKAMLDYLRESYINTDNTFLNADYNAKYYTDLIKNFVEKVEANRNDYEADLEDGVKNELAEESSKTIIDSINYKILDTLDASQIVTMAGISGVKTMLVESLKFGFDKIKDILPDFLDDQFPGQFSSGRFDKQFQVGGINIPFNIQLSDITDTFKSVLTSRVEKGVDDYLSKIQTMVRNGETLPEDMISEAAASAWAEIFNRDTLTDILKKLFTIAIAGAGAGEVSSLQYTDEVGKELLNYIETYLQIDAENVISGDDMDGKDVEKLIKGILKLGGKVNEDNLTEVNNSIQAAYKEHNRLEIEYDEYADYYSVTGNSAVTKDINDRMKELDQMEEDLSTEAEQLADNATAVKIVLNVAESWWEVGGSIRTALESTVSATSGEGIMSMLGMRIVACRNMSSTIKNNLSKICASKYIPLYTSGLSKFNAAIMNPDETPLEELYSILSQMYVQNQYDVVGASAYFDMVLHKDVFYSDLNSFSAKFARYISDHHINIQGGKGLLPYDSAANEYNHYVSLNAIYEMDERWSALFQ